MIDATKITITPEILNLVAEIDEFKGVWQEMGKLTPDRLLALKKIATIESIGSSTRIEGSKLTDLEVEALLSGANAQGFQNRDAQEVAGYAFVCEQIFDRFDAIPITENVIKELHIWLLRYCDKDERHRGEYKKIPIQIEAFDPQGESLGIVFETTSPMETPFKMEELIAWTNRALQEKIWHPLIVIALFVVIFLAIHPFQDGNGRLSRLLTTLLMMKCGYLYVPYSALESVIEANKESYYLALQKTQKSWEKNASDWTPWMTFFFQCLQRQKQHLEQKISREKMLMKELPELARQILNLLTSHGQLGISELERLTEANRNTLKKSLSFLVATHHIVKNGKGRATRYTL